MFKNSVKIRVLIFLSYILLVAVENHGSGWLLGSILPIEKKDQKGTIGVIVEKPEKGEPHGFITAENVGFSDSETENDAIFYIVRASK